MGGLLWLPETIVVPTDGSENAKRALERISRCSGPQPC